MLTERAFSNQASFAETATGAAKEVARYRQALRVGFEAVASSGLLTNNHILAMQAELEENRAPDPGVTRLTATRSLDALVSDGILEKRRIGRSNYYINTLLYAILTGEGMTDNGV